ncbi:nitroreductase family deazaflavin-dependent oxidoreductase [Actinocorallia sp. A-T 12471]|uniref:nitroreductase family deazaflavin-dependent oxidoreductase n=1 Tax=Actinocorallia sp. A-T 12471 TaxID=3089813 RepID=UPI0029D2BC76|nr:nitroreductase family deazaflavin-dependent oxidoreductase [Actinocorallia sp. A-T 12471]MDX6739467.1 nitroreductase family deazaflavin-dependent oxidoreductase [Actinocorallia sp. A-T 12471]
MSAPTPVQRVFRPLFQSISGSAWFAKVGPKVVPPLDRGLHRITGGRMMLAQALIPTLYLTTTGAKSGQPRVTPLLCMPEDGGWIVVGSNFGQDKHPAWTGNLLKQPRASVEFRKRTYDVTGVLLEGAEREETWTRLNALWPVFRRYQSRAERDLRVFRLTPSG